MDGRTDDLEEYVIGGEQKPTYSIIGSVPLGIEPNMNENATLDNDWDLRS